MSQPPSKGHRSKHGDVAGAGRSPHSPVQAARGSRSTAGAAAHGEKKGSSGAASDNLPARIAEPTTSTPRGITLDRAVSSVCRLLESLDLPEVASALRTKFRAQGRDDSADAEAWRSFASTISKQFSQAHQSPTPPGDTSPSLDASAEWSRDAVEKSVVPMVQSILETDKYIPRHVLKSITQKMNASSREVVTPIGTGRSQAYPRYRAPMPLGRTGRSRCTFPAPTSALPLAPLDTDVEGSAKKQQQQTPRSDGRRLSGADAKVSRADWAPFLDRGDGPSKRAPSLRPFTECKASEIYSGKVAGAPIDNDPFAKDDEYRDDDDPGHRIRELWEAELVEEVRARERQSPEAQKIPFFAAFIPTYITPSSRRVDSGCGRSSIGSERRGELSSPLVINQGIDVGSPVVSSASARGAGRRTSVSSQSTNSLYALNSTPPPNARGAAYQAPPSSQHGSDSPFSSRRSEALSKSVIEDPAADSQPSNRCLSPTFGSPTNCSPERKGGFDDVFGEQRSTTAILTENTSFGNSVASNDGGGSGPAGGATKKDRKSQEASSPPGENLDDELAYCTSETPKSTSVATAPPSGGEYFGSLSDRSRSKDSPGSRLTRRGDAEAPEDTGERWAKVYCDGDAEQFRRRKREERILKQANLLNPESGDPTYPLIEDSGKVVDCFNLKVIYERDKTGFEESKDFPVNVGTSIAGRYVIESQLGQAAFSKALRCYDRMAKRHVCMKVIRNEKDYVDQCLDEIKLLRYINCNGDVDLVHCLRLLDFFYYKEHLIIVTELLKENLYEFSSKCRKAGENYFTMGKIQRVAYQTLIALEYIHSLRLIHSDLKPENILIKNEATCEVKVIDFGSSCYEDDVLSLYVQSRSYRAPEVLLGLPYDQKIDIWSLGCIIAELWTGYVLFQNESVTALLARIVGILGRIPYYMICKGQAVADLFTQDGQIFQFLKDGPAPLSPDRGRRIRLYLPKKSNLRQRMRTMDEVFISFLSTLLQIDPSKRPSASEALQHPWLTCGLYSDGL